MRKRILITGAGGYIGSKMVTEYLKKGYSVIALDHYFFGHVFKNLKDNRNLTIVKGDTRFFNKRLLKGVHAVIDLAAISNDPSSELNPNVTHEVNYKGPVRVAKIAKEMGVSKYIFSSSCSVYGGGLKLFKEDSKTFPVSLYAKSKVRAEKELLDLADKKFSVTVLRNATVYGLSVMRMRFDLIINIMTLHAWKNRKLYVLGGGKQWRPLIHIDDCINTFHTILNEKDIKKINKEIFNVGFSEQNYQVIQIAKSLKKHFSDLVIELVPDDPDKRNYRVSFDKIKKTFGLFASKTIHDGIKEIKEALDRKIIKDHIKTRTLDYYQHLIKKKGFLKRLKLDE